MPSCLRVTFCILSCEPAFITILYIKTTKNKTKGVNIEQFETFMKNFGEKKNQILKYIQI